MEQAIFILIAAAVAILNWIVKSKERAGVEPPDQQVRPSQTSPSRQSEEERMRKFMEALGIPPDSTPPPRIQPRKVQQRQDPQYPQRQAPRQVPQRRAVPPPVPAGTGPARSVPLAEPPRFEPSVLLAPPVPLEPQVRLGPETAPYKVDLHEQSALKPVTAAGKETVAPAKIDLTSLPALLRQPESLRAAFVLKEVLGTPRSLQAQLIGGI